MTRYYYYRPWKDESLVSALHFLRCRIIRDGLNGQEHTDALLRQLDVDPETLPLPQKRPKAFRKGERRRAVLDALRDGPKTGAEVTRFVMEQSPGLTYPQVYKRVYACLNALKVKGVVRRDGRVWRVAARNCPH